MISLTIRMNQLVLYLVKMFNSLAQRLVQVLSLRVRMGQKKHGKISLGIRYLKIFFTRLVDLRPIFPHFRLWCPTTTTCNALNATRSWVIGMNSGGTRSTTKRFKCSFSFCRKAFSYQKDLRRHQRSVHPENQDSRFYCKYEPCKYSRKGFSRQDNFNRHTKTHLRTWERNDNAKQPR